MTKTAVIIQARMGSTRLPGKVLMDLGGQTVLAHVVARCQAIENADIVCCAIPESAENDPVAAEAERAGAVVFRGSDADVLERYNLAAKQLNADVVLRVTADCPLLDPAVSAAVLKVREAEDADFATNNLPLGWPYGLDCEAITFGLLERTHKEATGPLDRMHVSTYIRQRPEIRKVNLDGPGGDMLDHRWALDYPEDLAFLRALFAVLPPAPAIPDHREIIAVLRAHPEIFAINRMYHSNDYDPDAYPEHDTGTIGKTAG